MRPGLFQICAAILPRFLLGFTAVASADPLTVKTAQGKVHGKTINGGRVRAFLGLPYAAPPVGDLRWKAPEPAAHWKGERDATKYGAHCVQTPFEDMSFQDAGASEDCLYLNVFTPADAKGSSKLPVMFWIHGGGYFGGSASEPRHNGDFLPTKGVVLITINYRLGVFGFLVTDELLKEGNGVAGNWALLDMIAALQWVKDNIARFGGDPGNVTIFGESAGSFAVSTLMASPMAQGLFQKAIGESGAALGDALGGDTAAQQAASGSKWVTSLGVTSLAELRAMSTDDLLKASGKPGTGHFSTVIDGRVLTEPVADTYAAGKQAHVPLLAGWNRDEGGDPGAQGITVASWKERATTLFGDHSAEFLSLYPGDDDAQALRSSIDFKGDSFIAFDTWKWLEAQVKTGESPVYRYHFELAAPPSKFHPDSSAFHSDDIEYVFGTLDARPGAVWRDEDRKLSELIMDYWTNFARTGDPNEPGLPEWPRYDKTGAVLHLDRETHASPDTTRARYEFLLGEMPAFRP
jgi:para-nitrobenzyl esterase